MEKTLGQSDIDALFAAASASTAAIGEDSGETAVRLFNFSHAGQINKDELKAISTLNDLFARNLMHTLGAWLRMQFHVNLVSGEQLPYSEFISRLSKPTYVCSIGLEPFDAQGLLELDLALASPIVDVLLGGVGQAAVVRELTDIEEEILGSVVKMILQELNIAWRSAGLALTYGKRESESQAARLMGASEKTLCVSFEVRMPEAQGMLNLCLPAAVVNAILRRMIAEGDRPRRRSREAQGRMRELMGEATVGAVLQFPPMRLRAKELAALMPGSILRLPLPRHADAELRIGGLTFGRAHPVRTGEHRGAQFAPQDIGDVGMEAETMRVN